MVHLEVLLKWYLDANKKQQRFLDEADFLNSVLNAVTTL